MTRSTPRHRRRRRAFTLVHILFALMLLGAFAVVATKVFRLSVLSSQSAAVSQERDLRREQALHALRQDVWQSQSIEAIEPAKLRLSAPDGPIEWRTTGDEGDLIRVKGKETLKWTELHLRFARQGRAILIIDKDQPIAVLEPGARR
jgi:type II secretory pathway pseudopilin PulG